MTATIVWLGVMIILLIIEIATMGLTTIWFAGGALAACIAALCGAGYVVQAVLFLAVSLLLLFFTRPVAMRHLNRNTTKTNVESLEGQDGVVTETVENLKARGRVQLRGMDWTARTERDDEILPVGEKVTVIRVEGVKLIVKGKEK